MLRDCTSFKPIEVKLNLKGSDQSERQWKSQPQGLENIAQTRYRLNQIPPKPINTNSQNQEQKAQRLFRSLYSCSFWHSYFHCLLKRINRTYHYHFLLFHPQLPNLQHLTVNLFTALDFANQNCHCPCQVASTLDFLHHQIQFVFPHPNKNSNPCQNRKRTSYS